jgi:hypothetical protein
MHIVKKAHEIHSHAVKVYPRSQLKEHRSLQYNLTVLIGSEMTERTLVLISYSVQHHVAYADKKNGLKAMLQKVQVERLWLPYSVTRPRQIWSRKKFLDATNQEPATVYFCGLLARAHGIRFEFRSAICSCTR